MSFFWFIKVALSQKVFPFVSNLKKEVSNHSPEHYLQKGKMLREVIRHLLFGDLSQREKKSEIKPPLVDLSHLLVYLSLLWTFDPKQFHDWERFSISIHVENFLESHRRRLYTILVIGLVSNWRQSNGFNCF